MRGRDFDLQELLDIPRWEKVQDQLAKMTGTAIITIDMKGVPVTKHSCRTEFCSVIRENPVSRKRCQRCDALAGLEAVRLERPYIYLCHCGIVDVAVPVMVGDRYLGAVMFGQVRIPNDDTDNKVKRLINEISSFQPEGGVSRNEIMEMYNRLPEMKYSRIVEIAELIRSIVEYITDGAVKSQYDKQIYNWLVNSDFGHTEQGHRYIQELVDPNETVQEKLDATEIRLKKNSPIYPAIMYIKAHPKEMITMKAMADLCHLSESYFSRLFSREMGENFVNYVNRGKIDRAKILLRESNQTVSQIAGEVGYVDVSHFIRIFKRFVGVTPAVYRQYNFK